MNLIAYEEHVNNEYISPFHHSNYDFITENSVDINDSFIHYAEKTLNRDTTQIAINNIINDPIIADSIADPITIGVVNTTNGLDNNDQSLNNSFSIL